ncbi:MAG: peptidase [Sphingobacteriaceae bacterium]|jgi:hypothetical protein|nr:peptidase [Sphingobacteriaceae bacterium]
MLKKLSFFVLLAIAQVSIAQTSLPIPVNIEQAFKKGTRSLSGKPGANYWQNTANYTIKVKFDPATREVAGTVDIAYINNSPDTLKQVLFKLYPNLYQKGAPRASRIAPEDINDGVQIQKVVVNGKENSGRLAIDNTNWNLRVMPIAPKQSANFSITYSYILNKGSHNRTGQVDETSDFVAYFFPRIAVYDDVDGWNRYPYRGSEEFYNDFCNFDAEITVPDKFVVWATGDLTNASQVFNETIVKRIQSAEKSDAVVDVIDSTDLKRGNITKQGSNTWKFSAKNVTDFVFATSDHYFWKSASLVVDPKTGRRTRVDAVFNPIHKDYYEVIDFARKTVEAMSYKFPKWPYPYSHETVFDGLDQMEYPMMVNDNPLENRTDAITLTDHEIFHTMFPFYMGINETKYGWMDEGWATIGEWLISPMIDPSIDDDYGVEAYARSAGTEADLPIVTLTPQQSGIGSFTNVYPKPAMGYLYVKDMLGNELFTKALHNYISLWNGKHPLPWDFFNSMNAGAGQDLNWFWKRWFFDDGIPDLAITSVKALGKGFRIVVEMKGAKPVPVDLTLNYSDNTTEKIHRSVVVWKNAKSVSIDLATSKKIVKAELGSTHVPDSNKKDNVWVGK